MRYSEDYGAYIGIEPETEPDVAHESPLDAHHTEIVVSPTGGKKGQKMRRIDLIPPESLGQVGDVYGHGATKYGERNYELGYNWSLCVSALHRHLNAWQRGESIDPESPDGTHHLAAVCFHAMTLMEFERTHPEFDDVHGALITGYDPFD